ncbi:MAG: 50S ribosomal protein L6 [Sphingobacteriales bacterium]|jgi:large subunit ribosomal protein L6|nr:50S ribosomal protein L6 [Sphingobacteriales bacterium]MBP9140475.1 50S ribosomal protein L6 [Chitinophagales bacterium]MDA0197425.1 50S ribosomal protein L6 [Bacteroidota bacterium]MBK6891265.1 50S ribosomal protein L6 [Sphingobacteriales bacterium]MBK7526906.1 50S ribosomal protein L6 [Sphingobacteriales bacterium]
MSRIGKMPITVPANVNIDIDKNNMLTVKGPKGELKLAVDRDIELKVEDNNLTVNRPTDQKRHRSLHGLYRALVNNMVLGVSQGFTTILELVGVGYRATCTGQILELQLGFSHPIYFVLPKEVTATTTAEKGQNPSIILQSLDKQLLGQVCAKIRSFRKPEPFKGKGILFKGEVIRRKAGKTAA